MTSQKLGGAAFPFVFADATGEKWLESPVQHLGTSIYLGAGPAVPEPGTTFVQEALLWRARDVLGADHPSNPFPCPLVMAELA